MNYKATLNSEVAAATAGGCDQLWSAARYRTPCSTSPACCRDAQATAPAHTQPDLHVYPLGALTLGLKAKGR